MYLNHYKNHLSYISNFDQYAKRFRCQNCDQLWDHHGNFKQHQKTCADKTKYRYPGGFFSETKTIFQELEVHGINVPDKDRVFPWFSVFDFESILQKVEDVSTDKLEWTHKHVPISVSVCSNIPGFDRAQCLINEDLDSLLSGMLSSLSSMRDKCLELSEDRWGWVLKELDSRMNSEIEETSAQAESIKCLRTIYGKFRGYMSTLPVIGFNSAKYDLNLIKQKLAKHLRLDEQKLGFTIKKNNSYACISTDEYKFLDISHFLAPGTSYTGFLKAYRVEETKGYFCYEFLDDIAKLDYPNLPPREAFYSSLKNEHISEENYRYCQTVWRDMHMQTFRDFLTWYNNLDVQPFVTAVERLQSFYFGKGVDVFKTAISCPGIARQLLFKSARKEGAEFSLFDRSNKDLYQTVKDNIVGGPSIIFTRYHKAGETLIRGEKRCEKVLGYDANALYLWSIGQSMPEGIFVRRRAENFFKPEYRDHQLQAFHWLNYMNRYEDKQILHYRNNGKEKRVGIYPVDGFDPRENTVYQFHGCYFHGHQCRLTTSVNNEQWLSNRQAKYDKTASTTEYIKSKGFSVVEMWECDFIKFRENHPRIYSIINEDRPTFAKRHKGKVTEKQILDGVRAGTLFGMIEVDIEVPDKWGQYFERQLPPRQYFDEMCPLFCNTEVAIDDIGEHMQAHVREYGLSDQPRRLLVGGMKARQILLATPLLKWYLNHGMNVTKIYQVVEYREKVCFKTFVDEVSDARRDGDASKDLGIIADTMKLIGNSGYGSLIMDKTKHRKIDYKRGENEACISVNSPQFRQMTCLDETDELYEIELAKRVIKLDLPIQLGFFILQYAKLRMLEFYYDFLDRYVDRSNFEYLEMDTDSAYMAISAESLEDVIKPEMVHEYRRGLKGMCDDRIRDANSRWLPRTCCDKHSNFDRRVPGLFKTEFEGQEMVGLCSKTYVVAGDNQTKFSSKGVSKRFIDNPMQIYKDVLSSKVPQSGLNKGFRVRNNTIYTYHQERCGFSYFYCKRKVLDDGIHTVPLQITLCPVKPKMT